MQSKSQKIEKNSFQFEENLNKLQVYIEREKYKGYDPIDIHNSFLPFNIFPNYLKAIISQIHLRNPINLRPLLGIKKEYNPMALGVILEAYSIMYRIFNDNSVLEKMNFIFTKLIELSSQDFKGYCWGNNFDWSGLDKTVPKYHPNIVTTCHVARGVYEFYKITNEKKSIDVLLGIESFILGSVPIINTSYGICFSYTDLEKEVCYNANMLAAEILAKTSTISKNMCARKYAKEAVCFTMAHQQTDGHWNYSIDLNTGIERQQIDFHQGYILMSLYEYMKYGDNAHSYKKELLMGLRYYEDKQFFENGRAKWRVPKSYPIESHHHAIGITTFAKLSDLGEEYLTFAQKIAMWAVGNLFDNRGFFYFRKYSGFRNKISYLRWTQSFMLLAFSILRQKMNKI